MMATIASLVIAGLAGAIAHELAHWMVWAFTGRDPELDLWKLEVRPRTGPMHTTAGDRVAAGAPYLSAVCALAIGASIGSWPLIFFGAFQFGIPSLVDIRTILGHSEWSFHASPTESTGGR